MNPTTLDIHCTGYVIKADWYGPHDTNDIILALPGWPSVAGGYKDLLTTLHEKTGKSSLVFDYSGCGGTRQDPSTTRPAQHFLEVVCVFDWLQVKYPSAKITVIGTSYGGYLATQLTKYRTFKNLILRAPAIYQPQDFYTYNILIARSATDTYRHNAEALSKHPLLARASSFAGKTLVVVNENDEQIPKATTDAYINAFNADVYMAKGYPHTLADQPRDKIREYQNAIIEWLKKNGDSPNE
jgi:predicted esterase YcpF (UPF0227 family)